MVLRDFQAAKKIKNRMQQLGGMFERRDMEKLGEGKDSFLHGKCLV